MVESLWHARQSSFVGLEAAVLAARAGRATKTRPRSPICQKTLFPPTDFLCDTPIWSRPPRADQLRSDRSVGLGLGAVTNLTCRGDLDHKMHGQAVKKLGAASAAPKASYQIRRTHKCLLVVLVVVESRVGVFVASLKNEDWRSCHQQMRAMAAPASLRQ